MKTADTPSEQIRKAETRAKREVHERAFALQCRHVSLNPVPQFKIPGLNYVYDFAFPAHMLLIEIQGGTAQRPIKMGARWWIPVSGHNSMDGIQRDCQKGNAAQMRGWTVLHFTAQDIADMTALTMVREFLDSRCPF